jgi:hypothetical protein
MNSVPYAIAVERPRVRRAEHVAGADLPDDQRREHDHQPGERPPDRRAQPLDGQQCAHASSSVAPHKGAPSSAGASGNALRRSLDTAGLLM